MSAVLEAIAAAPPRCPVCAGEAEHRATMPIDAVTLRETPHGHVYACVRCALGFVHPRPKPGETHAFRPPQMVQVPAPGLLARLRKRLASRLDQGIPLCNVIEDELPARSKIVDIGCGPLVKDLAARGHRVTAIERDAGAVALPRSLELGSCDGVVFSHGVQHLVDPVQALADAAALLKPSGLLFCEVPNNEALVARRSGLAWQRLDIARHVNFFTERSLVALVRSAGLVVRRVYFGGYSRCFDDATIATEQRIYDRLAALPGGVRDAKRNSPARAWRLLARTALAHPRFKYDSIGIVAGWPPALM